MAASGRSMRLMLVPYCLSEASDRMTTASTPVGYTEPRVSYEFRRLRYIQAAHTLVCHIVIEVDVMTAKMWPARATRKAKIGSLGGELLCADAGKCSKVSSS